MKKKLIDQICKSIKIVILLILVWLMVLSMGCGKQEDLPYEIRQEIAKESNIQFKTENETIKIDTDQKHDKDVKLAEFQNNMSLEAVKSKYSNISKDKVKMIQKKLEALGYQPGKADGIIGKNTLKAIAEYQYDNGDTIDGVLKEQDIIDMGIVEKMEVTITLKSVTMLYNDSVGSEWGYSFTVNNVDYNKGESHKFTIEKKDSINITAQMTEYDKIPDNGYSSCTYNYNELKNLMQSSRNLDVIVVENRGRYSGNSASWKFTYLIKINYIVN